MQMRGIYLGQELRQNELLLSKILMRKTMLTKPQRTQVERVIFKEIPIHNEEELIENLLLLWRKEEREFQYAALVLARKYKKLHTPAFLSTLEIMIREKSWWDTVDDIAANLLGSLLKTFPEHIAVMDRWIVDSNLWIRRSALLHQLKWKKETNHRRLYAYCEKLMAEKDFFIRKAIGWVLREYSKTNPDSVRDFINKNRPYLSPLSIREGSKYI